MRIFTDRKATSGSGGGIKNDDGTLFLTSTTLVSNTAIILGGGLYNLLGGVTIENSTFSSNTATVLGGGIYNDQGLVTANNTTLNGNHANSAGGIGIDSGAVFLKNTIVANSPSGGDCGGVTPVISQGYNLDSDDSCNLIATGDISNTNPLLGPLQDNGGDTLTHALKPASLAIDAGDDSACLSDDQRGFSRPYDGNGDGIASCDIGAFESYAPTQSYAVYLPFVTKN